MADDEEREGTEHAEADWQPSRVKDRFDDDPDAATEEQYWAYAPSGKMAQALLAARFTVPWWTQLPDEQRQSVQAYQDGAFVAINAALRGAIALTPELREQVHRIEVALAAAPPLDHGITAYRGSRARGLIWETELAAKTLDPEDLPGTAFTVDGFSSLTLLAYKARRFAWFTDRRCDSVFFTVRVPAGTSALYLAHTESPFADQLELLLAPGWTYTVIEAHLALKERSDRSVLYLTVQPTVFRL